MPILGQGESVTAVKWGAQLWAGWMEPPLISCPCRLGASLAGRCFPGQETGSAELLSPVDSSLSLGQGWAPASSPGRAEGQGRAAGAEALTLCSSGFVSRWEARFSHARQEEV